jgi:hypothetical protein
MICDGRNVHVCWDDELRPVLIEERTVAPVKKTKPKPKPKRHKKQKTQ